MARKPRIDVGDHVYHIINRANARLPIFFEEEDYEMFEHAMLQAKAKYPMRILAYCIMPNHFHLILYPEHDGDLQKFMQWLTLSHTQRWHLKNKTIGTGHLYQGRYKSSLIEDDTHLLTAIRYVERNPLRAHLVTNLENWKFGSYWRRMKGSEQQKKLIESEWPIEMPKDYSAFVHEPMTAGEIESMREVFQRGYPFASRHWLENKREIFGTVEMRSVGRPKSRKTV